MSRIFHPCIFDRPVFSCLAFSVAPSLYRFTRYEAMNGGAKCRKWGGLRQLGVTQGQPQCHHSTERIDFLFDFNRNHVSIFIIIIIKGIYIAQVRKGHKCAVLLL